MTTFTSIHVLLSLVGICSGFVVMIGLLTGKRLDGWTALFLSSTVAWKGEASYYDIVVRGKINKDSSWYYPSPKEAAKHSTGYVAFWKGVHVDDR